MTEKRFHARNFIFFFLQLSIETPVIIFPLRIPKLLFSPSGHSDIQSLNSLKSKKSGSARGEFKHQEEICVLPMTKMIVLYVQEVLTHCI